MGRFQINVVEVRGRDLAGIYVVYACATDNPTRPSCSTSFWLIPGTGDL